MKPVVDENTCVGCGVCMSVCPAKVFSIENGKSKVVKPEACTGCNACVMNCPVHAITLTK